MIKYTVKVTTQFKKDYKLAMKRGLKTDLLEQIVEKLASDVSLPEKNKDHALTGNWRGHRECHILPDWLHVYRIEDDVLILTLARTGTVICLESRQCRWGVPYGIVLFITLNFALMSLNIIFLLPLIYCLVGKSSKMLS
ncbi:type II toxin-antitoxin system YafQ family toxin [Paenibacillus turicensis]|jgi:mRNA interferase YafQ|uniref:type II toxin-antitoxin system YafQ family toxin n=1 Tax=Paenibacillus turicensis TaxID=160487 RepID=UPI003D27F07C